MMLSYVVARLSWGCRVVPCHKLAATAENPCQHWTNCCRNLIAVAGRSRQCKLLKDKDLRLSWLSPPTGGAAACDSDTPEGAVALPAKAPSRLRLGGLAALSALQACSCRRKDQR